MDWMVMNENLRFSLQFIRNSHRSMPFWSTKSKLARFFLQVFNSLNRKRERIIEIKRRKLTIKNELLSRSEVSRTSGWFVVFDFGRKLNYLIAWCFHFLSLSCFRSNPVFKNLSCMFLGCCSIRKMPFLAIISIKVQRINTKEWIKVKAIPKWV